MKKVLNIIFTLMLGLSMIACSKSSLLKNSLEAGAGWGDLIINETNISIAENLGITASALDFTQASISTDDKKTGTLGTQIKNVKSGTRIFTLKIPSADKKWIYVGTNNIDIVANQLSEGKIVVSEKKAFYKLKFTLTSEVYAKIKSSSCPSFEDIEKIYIVGKHSEWENKKVDYPLIKNSDGKKWEGTYEIEEGNDIKYIIVGKDKSESWTVGDNYLTFESKSIFNFTDTKVEFMVTEDIYDKVKDKPTVYSAITSIYVVGPHSNWENNASNFALSKNAEGDWTGSFDKSKFEKGAQFKYIINTNEWTKYGHIRLMDIEKIYN